MTQPINETLKNMKKINAGTAMQTEINQTYNYAMRQNIRTLWEAYKRPSYEKERAYNYCENLFAELNGYNFRIAGHGVQTFSVTFEFDNPEDGKTYLVWVTKSYDRYTEKL